MSVIVGVCVCVWEVGGGDGVVVDGGGDVSRSLQGNVQKQLTRAQRGS